jgi:hypothetical protein
MKKKLVVLLTAVIPLFCSAQNWIKTGETSDSENYIDPSTVKFNGKKFKIWGITNFKKQEPDGVKSQRYQDEYDCVNELRRSTYLSSHYEKFGDGGIKFNSPINEPWRPIPPGTVADQILKLIFR